MAAIRRQLELMTLHGMSIMLANEVPKCSKGEPRQRVVANAEREAILGQCKPDLRIHLLLCGDLGLRAGTAVRVAGEHWDRQTDEIRINAIKHGASIVTPLTEELKQLLLECERKSPFAPDTVPYVVRARGNNQRYADNVGQVRQLLGRRFKRICKQLGIANMRPHDFRRTFAENIYRETGDLRIVMGALGHKSLLSTAHYLQRSSMKPSRELLEKVKQTAC